MGINQFMMYLLAFGVLLGGADRVLGNRYGYGDKFEEGFRLLGPVGLSMAGIYCLAPLAASVLEMGAVPLCRAVGIDPAVLGSVLAIDMGGYPLAMDLAVDPLMGKWAGIIVTACFGCTVVFTIPVGLETIRQEDRPYFIRGILLGFAAMPVSILSGGLVCGLSVWTIFWNALPVLLICLLLGIGVVKRPQLMIRLFRVVSRFVQILATVGLTLAAAQHISGKVILTAMPPLQEAMEVVCGIGIVMLGSMPLAELIQRLLKGPFSRIREKTGLNGVSTAALLLGMVSTTPALAMIPQMDRRGKVVCSACLVCYVGLLGSHLAFTVSAAPEMLPALLVSKVLGGGLAAGIALFATRKEFCE